MKIKSKLILAATSLLVLSGVAAGTSTYAWYTANRQVELGITNISATAQLTTLNMSYEYAENERNGVDATGLNGTDPFTVEHDGTEESYFSTIAGTFSKNLTDVSSMGDGNYSKPIFGANETDLAGFWTTEDAYADSQNATNDLFYHELVFTFTLTGEETVALYLSPTSEVLENDTGADDDLAVADAVRFSVSYMDDLDAKTEMLYANPNGYDESYYLSDESDITKDAIPTTGGLGILEAGGTDSFFDKSGNYTEANMYYGTGTPETTADTLYNSTDAGFIAEVDPTGGVTLHVAVDVWIEGTDDDCAELISDEDYYGLFDLKLGFYTLSKSNMEDTGI
jgi:hypothetical protein